MRWSGQLVADLGWLGFFRATNPAPTGLFPYILRLLFPQAIAIATTQPIPVQPKKTLITIVLPLFGIDLWFAIKLGKKYITAQMSVNIEKASIGKRLARIELGIADRELGETGTAVKPVKKRFRKRPLAAWQLPWAQVAA